MSKLLLSILDRAQILLSILDSTQRVCGFEYQFDCVVQRWRCCAEHCITDDVRAAVLCVT